MSFFEEILSLNILVRAFGGRLCWEDTAVKDTDYKGFGVKVTVALY